MSKCSTFYCKVEELLDLVCLEEITIDDMERVLVNECFFLRDSRVRSHSFKSFNLDRLSNWECR